MMLPILTDLKTWSSSLIIDFPNDNVPILSDEKKWKLWGNTLIQENSFAENGAPGTEKFDDWQSWAQSVFKQMANT